MNPLEKQFEIGRELVELNTQWFKKIAEFDVQNVQKYVELNQSFAQRLPEVKDVESFVGLQREYGETLWNGAQEVMRARGELVREVASANGEVLKSVYAPAEETKAEAKVETKAKAKTKAAESDQKAAA